MERLTIQVVSELITSKAGREYFTLEDSEGKRYVCFNPKLKDYCKAGTEIEADLIPGKSPDDSPRIAMIYVNGIPVVQRETKTAGQRYGKSKEELIQQRELAEAQNRSIQAQTSLNRAVDLAVAGKIGEPPLQRFDEIAGYTRAFYQLLQSLTQISEGEVIHREIKALAKSKSDKETPVDQVEQPPLKPARADDRAGGEAPEWAVWLWGKVKEGGWKSKTLIQYLNNTFSLTLDLEQNIEEACLQLTPSQRQLFFGELELWLKNKED